MPRVSVPRTSSNPGEIGAVELGCSTVLGFSQVDSAQSECGAEECVYIRPAPLAGLSVCARTVTGSLLFGSPHRLVWSCLNILMFPSWRQEGDKSSQLNDLATGIIDLWAKRREVFSSFSSSRKINVFLSWGILSSRQSAAQTNHSRQEFHVWAGHL